MKCEESNDCPPPSVNLNKYVQFKLFAKRETLWLKDSNLYEERGPLNFSNVYDIHQVR